MEDFFDKLRTPNAKADRDYLGSEAKRLRAYLYTLREEDRLRELERLQTDLTYWHLVLSHKELDFDYNSFEYALYLLADLKKGLGLEDSKELRKLLDLALGFNWVGCGATIADLPDRDKVSEIIFILDGGNSSGFGIYRAFALIGVEPSLEDEEPEGEPTQPRKLPDELSGAMARHRLKKAQDEGLLDKNYYWIESKENTLTLCAFFCACLNASCDIHAKAPKEEGGGPRNEWKLYEGFFFPEGKKVDLANNFGTVLHKIKRETLNKGQYRKILDFCDVSLSKIVPLKHKK